MTGRANDVYTNPECYYPFSVTVTHLTKTGFSLIGTYPITNGADCVPTLGYVATFEGCTAAEGNLTTANGTFGVSVSKNLAAGQRAPKASASLSKGLK
jgi:hypothetical protein